MEDWRRCLSVSPLCLPCVEVFRNCTDMLTSLLLSLQSHSKWGYKGGRRLFQSVPTGFGYADLMYKMCEKLASDVSLKYLSPGEELSPDNLISVTDDDDVQVSFCTLVLQAVCKHPMCMPHKMLLPISCTLCITLMTAIALGSHGKHECRKCLLSTGGVRVRLMPSRTSE